jgi:hypothetical protein
MFYNPKGNFLALLKPTTMIVTKKDIKKDKNILTAFYLG